MKIKKKIEISDLIKDNGGLALIVSKWDENEDLANIIEEMAEHSKLAVDQRNILILIYLKLLKTI